MAWRNKRPAVCTHKPARASFWRGSPKMCSFSSFSCWFVFMHLNFHSHPRFFSMQLSPVPPFSTSITSLVRSPLTLLSLWCQPPGLLDQRAILGDHLERPVEVEEVKGRGGTRNGESVGKCARVCVCARGGSGGGGSVRLRAWGEGGLAERKFFCQGRVRLRFVPSSFNSPKCTFHTLACTCNRASTEERTITHDLGVLGVDIQHDGSDSAEIPGYVLLLWVPHRAEPTTRFDLMLLQKADELQD